MKTSIVLALFCLIAVLRFVDCHNKKQVIKVTIKEDNDGSGMMKKKAEIAGLVSGATAGFAKGILKEKGKKSKVNISPYRPVAVHQPKFKVEYVRVVKPILVRVEPEPENVQLYVKKEEKKMIKKKNVVFPYLKGFFKGKFIGKSIGKTIGKTI